MTDQRGEGFPRTVQGTVDVGAFERPGNVGPATVYTVNLTSATGAGSGNSGDLVYCIGLADANTSLAGSVIEFDPTVFATHRRSLNRRRPRRRWADHDRRTGLKPRHRQWR